MKITFAPSTGGGLGLEAKSEPKAGSLSNPGTINGFSKKSRNWRSRTTPRSLSRYRRVAAWMPQRTAACVGYHHVNNMQY